ncbi:MAG: quinone-dependent dihydroorotate dehydrogenase [Salinivirgaceae bacterium]|nr:quinone-dependent dihydroorotate dehydrogenase [Salinivirgaceae bacterium]
MSFYTSLIRPALFKINPERIHGVVNFSMKAAQSLGLGAVAGAIYNPRSLQMETEFCGIKFPNRIGVAAGFDKNAEVYKMLGNLGFGHVEIGTVTPRPQSGNPKPRLFRLPVDGALINRMGFNNNGLEAAVKKLRRRNHKIVIGGNIGKNTATPNENAVDDYMACFRGLYDYVDYITINVSCPNVANLKKLQDKEYLDRLLGAITSQRKQQAVYKPILLKISPDLTQEQIDETLEIVAQNGIDGVVVANTSTKRDGLKTAPERIAEIANGGLSGQPLRDRSVEMIRYISEKTSHNLPIIGVGGTMSPVDAMAKIEAGATLVQVFTGFIYYGPKLAKDTNKYVKNHLHL